ncbi:MAG: transketolase [Candidatus Diapherotrites archaeon]|nr:transketolase [Candidatus Diapherotrites archaeon]
MQQTKTVSKERIQELREIARDLRIISLKMITKANSGHPGGSLSSAEIITALYFQKMKLDLTLKNPERDRFLMSKGHACPIVYSALYKLGAIPEEEVWKFRTLGGMLQGHPDRLKTPGVEMSSGSLGQGFSVACGMALAAKIDGRKNKVYAWLGDGETQEGIVWETAALAGFKKLNNLVAVIDKNGIQNDGFVKDILSVDPLDKKFEAFNWNVRVVNGHKVEEILQALDEADNSDKPFAIICNTVKGKGVSFINNNPEFHGKAPTPEQLEQAIRELNEKLVDGSW